jgi:hypothetical protein
MVHLQELDRHLMLSAACRNTSEMDHQSHAAEHILAVLLRALRAPSHAISRRCNLSFALSMEG